MTPPIPTIGETIGLPLLRAQMRLRWIPVALALFVGGVWALCAVMPV